MSTRSWIVRAGVALLVLLSPGCRGPEEPRYRVVQRLLDAVPLPGGQKRFVVHCVLQDDRRPAIGCAPRRLLTRLDDRDLEAVHEAIALPPWLDGHGAILQATVQPPDAQRPPEDLSPVILQALPKHPPLPSSQLGVSGPASGRVVSVWARELSPPTVITNAVAVPPRAVLSVALALDPVHLGSSVDAVEFTLTAWIGTRRQVLLQERLAADDPASTTWHERRVPLDAVAGPAVMFGFGARVVPRRGVPPAVMLGVPGVDVTEVTAVPLWGAPEILEVAGPDEPPNVLLVSLDTLRADHLGTYGSALPTSPHLDALAKQSVVFDRAIAPYPSTTASHMSMFTGLYPARHLVRGPTKLLADGTPTLAATLAAHGWRTSAVTEDAMIAPLVGFPIGFSEYRENRKVHEVDPMRGVESTIATAIDWLERHARERFFLFVHTYEVHSPYLPPPEYALFKTWQDGDRTRPIAEAPQLEQMRHAYAGEIRYADAQVQRLLDALDRLGLAEHTLVVVTADHGEEFGEHGGWTHNITLYEEALHVPLMMRAPGRLAAGRRIATPVSLVDLMPTILDLVGVPAPPGIDGESQLERMRDGVEDPDRMVFAELELRPEDARGRLVAARTATRKWIFFEKPQRVAEVYDLVRDPGEHVPIAGDDVAAQGLAAVAPYRDRLAGVMTVAAPEAVPLDEQLRRNLRALGYMH